MNSKIITILITFGTGILFLSLNVLYSQALEINLSRSDNVHNINITSPSRDQTVPAGTPLLILGSSSDNSTSDCHVGIIVNGKEPYQSASATGPGGANDYSTWRFTVEPPYAVINQGINDITAKFYCNNDPQLASYYGINISGNTSNNTSNNTSSKQQLESPIVNTSSYNNTNIGDDITSAIQKTLGRLQQPTINDSSSMINSSSTNSSQNEIERLLEKVRQ